MARGHSSPSDTTEWQSWQGKPVVDTMEVDRELAYGAAAWALKDDDWVLEPADPDSSRIVTKIKPLRHPLVRLFAGEVRARCEVTLATVTPRRTVVAVRGGLLTRRGHSGGPILWLARRTYSHEARAFLRKVRAELVHAEGFP